MVSISHSYCIATTIPFPYWCVSIAMYVGVNLNMRVSHFTGWTNIIPWLLVPCVTRSITAMVLAIGNWQDRSSSSMKNDGKYLCQFSAMVLYELIWMKVFITSQQLKKGKPRFVQLVPVYYKLCICIYIKLYTNAISSILFATFKMPLAQAS